MGRGGEDGDAKERCCPQETDFDICGSTSFLGVGGGGGRCREGSGAERLLGAVGRRV